MDAGSGSTDGTKNHITQEMQTTAPLLWRYGFYLDGGVAMDAGQHAKTELERLEYRMERRWYDLAMAEQRGQPAHVLERMYSRYLEALDAWVRCQAGNRSSEQRAS